MSFNFSYLIEKIEKCEFSFEPFKHLYIPNFLSDEHFNEILGSNEINFGSVNDDEELFEKLFANGYKVINFPGCINDVDTYKKWRRGEIKENLNNQKLWC